jgi:hypothetical protein
MRVVTVTTSPGARRLSLSTLMSAFPSSGRVNSWLYFKRAFQAVPGRTGGGRHDDG